MSEMEPARPEQPNGCRGDAESMRRTIFEQASEIDALRRHVLAANSAVNDARRRLDDEGRALRQALSERAEAWEENERHRADSERSRAEADALRDELERLRASRFYRLLLAYRRLYELPVLGPLLKLARRNAGAVLRRPR